MKVTDAKITVEVVPVSRDEVIAMFGDEWVRSCENASVKKRAKQVVKAIWSFNKKVVYKTIETIRAL